MGGGTYPLLCSVAFLCSHGYQLWQRYFRSHFLAQHDPPYSGPTQCVKRCFSNALFEKNNVFFENVSIRTYFTRTHITSPQKDLCCGCVLLEILASLLHCPHDYLRYCSFGPETYTWNEHYRHVLTRTISICSLNEENSPHTSSNNFTKVDQQFFRFFSFLVSLFLCGIQKPSGIERQQIQPLQQQNFSFISRLDISLLWHIRKKKTKTKHCTKHQETVQ